MKPVISSGGLVSNEHVNSTAFLAYFKYINEKIIVKSYGISGGNMHHFVMLGGFAGYTQSNGIEAYKPSKTTSAWIDIASANPKIAPGIFFGYTKNNGVEKDFKNLYVRGVSGNRIVDNAWRVSGRLDFKQNKFRISPEIEYTSAKWGDLSPEATAIGNLKTVGNIRILASVVYSF